MSHLKFKTNINCGGCITKVTPFLNELEGLAWSVDTDSKDKILSTKPSNYTSDEIISAVSKAGFKVELLRKKRFGVF